MNHLRVGRSSDETRLIWLVIPLGFVIIVFHAKV